MNCASEFYKFWDQISKTMNAESLCFSCDSVQWPRLGGGRVINLLPELAKEFFYCICQKWDSILVNKNFALVQHLDGGQSRLP